MLVKGRVFSGVVRGGQLVRQYYDRLKGLLGFEPYEGTLDIKLDAKIDIRRHSTKALDHLLLDGTKMTYAYLAPVTLITKQEGNEERYSCWAMQQVGGTYGDDIVEIIAIERLKDKLSLNDGDEVELEFTGEPEVAVKKSFLEKFGEKLPKPPGRLMRR